MEATKFITAHKKEMLWGAGFGIVAVLIGDAIIKILNFINMIMDYFFIALVWIINLPPRMVAYMHMSGSQATLIITGAIIGSILGIFIKPVFDFILKTMKRSPI